MSAEPSRTRPSMHITKSTSYGDGNPKKGKLRAPLAALSPLMPAPRLPHLKSKRSRPSIAAPILRDSSLL